ncbi:MAG: hypothetical protein LH465_09330 [Sphingomonas bacterium]|nr:hypothetical protein [Sphingomonas bacterium]
MIALTAPAAGRGDAEVGRNSRDPAYDDPALYQWLLSNRLPTKDKK